MNRNGSLPALCVVEPVHASGFRLNHDPHSMPSCLGHERKKRCENLSVEAAMVGFILLAGNYPVAMTGMVCLCRPVVNEFNKASFCYITILTIMQFVELHKNSGCGLSLLEPLNASKGSQSVHNPCHSTRLSNGSRGRGNVLIGALRSG